jgi:hypothetical protein
MVTQGPRTLYSEHEAADLLGVTIEQLRLLIKKHIVNDEDVPSNAVSSFQSSDLLILRILSGTAATSSAV